MRIFRILPVTGALCLFILLSSSASVSAQKKKPDCSPESISKCKYGFAPFKIGYSSVSKITPSLFGDWKRLIAYNFTLAELYAIAYGAGSTIPDDKLMLQVRNPEKLKAKYCYELNTPPELADNMFVLMLQHLEYQFPDYTAFISYQEGKNYIVVTDKEYGILLSEKPLHFRGKQKYKKDTTY